MNIIKASTRFALVRAFTRPSAIFRNSNWKERDEAAEKVYISQKEKQTLKKLLQKVEHQQSDRESNLQQFQRKLKQIMVRYRIENEALAAEIAHLHRDLRE